MRKVAALSASMAVAGSCMFGCGAAGGPRTQASSRASDAERGADRASAGSPLARRQISALHDGDDQPALAWGRAADGGDARAISALVRRYYRAGARDDGASACALTSPGFAETIPRDYVQEMGPYAPTDVEAAVRAAKTCAAVLSLLFERLHGQLAAPVEVIRARVRGDYGHAVIGSPSLPLSLVEVVREDGVWKLDGLLGYPLP